MRKLKTKKKKPNLIKRIKETTGKARRGRALREEGFIIKRPEEIHKLKRAGHLVAKSFELLGEEIKPGAVLKDLNSMVEAFIWSHGAESLYKGYRGNPPTQPPFQAPSVRRSIMKFVMGSRTSGYCKKATLSASISV